MDTFISTFIEKYQGSVKEMVNDSSQDSLFFIQQDSPPTTPHGRFENAFLVWRENFHRSFKFDVEVNPCVPTFGANLGDTTVIADEIFCGKAGGRVWQRNTQELTDKR